MGGIFRDRCLAALRPFVLAVLLCVAWMAWFAGTANAAADDPNPLAAIEQAADSLLQETMQEADSALVETIEDVPDPVAAVPLPVSDTAATVVDVVDPVVSGTTEVVTNVVDSAAPLLTGTPLVDAVTDTVAGAVDEVASVVDSVAPALPDIRLPTVSVPSVPRPTIPEPQIALPEVRVPLPGVGSRPAAPVSGVEAAPQAGMVRATDVTTAPQQVRRAVSPLQFLANTQAMRALAATIGYVVSVAPAPEPAAGLRFAGLHNQSGSGTSGTGSAGAEASADVAEFWNPLHDAARCLVPDAALIRAASPSFDPGSSPD